MKKIMVLLAAVIMLLYSAPPVYAVATPPPVIESESAVLMDAKTGQVLFQKNMDEQLYPASITKIMTILLGLENGNLNDTLTMSKAAVFGIDRGSSSIALDVGEQITLEQALMAAMLPSANDAANGIAEYVSGSIPQFVKLMNQRAVQAGALHTNFANPNGLCSDDHVTTAYDMAMITKAALMNDQFRRIFGTLKYDIPPTNKQPKTRHLYAEHRMRPLGRYAYAGFIGGKTGYTVKSEGTLVTAASRGDRELIVVVMKSQNIEMYTDTKALLDYGFNEFQEVPIIPPAAAAGNVANPQANLQMVKNILSPIKVANYTRLLSKNIDISDIVVDYTLRNDAAGKNDTLQMNMHLKNPSDFMYGNLGSIILAPPPAASGRPSPWLNIVFIVLKILAALVITILALKCFFTIRGKMRKKRRTFKDNQIISYYYHKPER